MPEDEEQTDRFGFKYMSTNQEVAVSFTLFTLGMILVISTFIPLMGHVNLGPGFLGVVMVGAAYFFMTEGVRELEEKDHFLARKLEKSDE